MDWEWAKFYFSQNKSQLPISLKVGRPCFWAFFHPWAVCVLGQRALLLWISVSLLIKGGIRTLPRTTVAFHAPALWTWAITLVFVRLKWDDRGDIVKPILQVNNLIFIDLSEFLFKFLSLLWTSDFRLNNRHCSRSRCPVVTFRTMHRGASPSPSPRRKPPALTDHRICGSTGSVPPQSEVGGGVFYSFCFPHVGGSLTKGKGFCSGPHKKRFNVVHHVGLGYSNRSCGSHH